MADGFHIPKISLIVIARNEEELIGQCLESAATFCDEMIVVDSFSTDRTVEIARTLGARVFEREFQGYIAQKQFAFEQARGEWIFSLDADEHATWELGREIQRTVAAPGAADGYRIRRILYHLDHYYTGGTYRDWLIRLCRRERGSFGGLEPHASVTVDGRIERLKSPILHFSYRDVADHVSTINRLSTLSALEGEPGALTAFKIAANPAWRFFNLYLLRGGFLDGGRGLYAAISSAFYVFLKYAKLYERRINNRYQS
ncbi:MAG TPA: glycosyltransferase family 2 protein [Candidatus Binataceae bacterium]|nr:glycosyltransferase family 2 protein [Candidatus Binataceae bacterium]